MNIGTPEMMLIVFVALILFGGKKLPELARGLGRGIREFKDASESIKRDISEQINDFEKDIEEDLEVKDLIVKDTTEEKQVPKVLEKASESTSLEAPKFEAPKGTYKHTPQRAQGSQPADEGDTQLSSEPQSFEENTDQQADEKSH